MNTVSPQLQNTDISCEYCQSTTTNTFRITTDSPQLQTQTFRITTASPQLQTHFVLILPVHNYKHGNGAKMSPYLPNFKQTEHVNEVQVMCPSQK
jgi:hypothetical protein